MKTMMAANEKKIQSEKENSIKILKDEISEFQEQAKNSELKLIDNNRRIDKLLDENKELQKVTLYRKFLKNIERITKNGFLDLGG